MGLRRDRAHQQAAGAGAPPHPLLQEEIHEYYANFRVSNDLLELRNLVQTADLIVRSAFARKESRGLHYSRDYPKLLPVACNTVLQPEELRPGLGPEAG